MHRATTDQLRVSRVPPLDFIPEATARIHQMMKPGFTNGRMIAFVPPRLEEDDVIVRFEADVELQSLQGLENPVRLMVGAVTLVF